MYIQNINFKVFFINILIVFIPVSYIAGNLLLNLNIFLLIISALILFGFEIFKYKLDLIDKLVIFLFSYILLNGFFNNFFNFNFAGAPDQNVVLIKSLFYLRFLILYFIIKYLIEKDLINFKFIFFSFGICCLFVSIDILIQFIFGTDLLGFKGSGRRLSGPFGDEYIAGSFIQRFFIFLTFSLLLFSNFKKKWFSLFILFSLLSVSFMGILLSGNRMPLVLFFLSLGIAFFYIKNLRIILIFSFLIFVVAISFIRSSNKDYRPHLNTLITKGSQIVTYFKNKVINEKIYLPNTHIKEFETGFLTWNENKYFGGGIKSYYFNCSKINTRLEIKPNMFRKINCSSHPHNYYIEIASELGLLGLILIITLFFVIITKSLKRIHSTRNNFINVNLLLPFVIIFLVEIFPFKTTGSFFTSTNSTFLFIIISFIVGLMSKKNEIKNI